MAVVAEVFDERFSDDASGVVLSGVEFAPVDVVDFRAHFLAELLTGAAGHGAQVPYQLPELRRVPRKPLRTHDYDSKESQQYEFDPVDSQHKKKTTTIKIVRHRERAQFS